ncbi:MAG: sortase [Chloroflexota bacterium]|nr:sortase [Chloroflexota bacterium]
MSDVGSEGQAGSGSAAQALVLGGVLLLLVGGLLVYPHVSSRLAIIPHAPPPTLSHSVASTLTPTLTSSHSPIPTLPRTSTPVSGATLIPTHIRGATPTPARPTHILIPAIGVDAPIAPISWQTAEVDGQTQAAWDVPDAYAAGWHETSAPLGAIGNTVLNGHNTTNGEVFRDLYTLKAGSVITLYSGDVPYTYAVSETLILPEAGQPLEVRLENARYILPTGDERLTLVTCHPYGSLQYRLIVIARPNGE